MASDSVAIVAAAGRSERFGSPKQLAEVDGVPMLERVIALLREGGVEEVVVVLAEDDPAMRERVPSLDACRVVVNPKPERGMFSSLQEGLNAAPPAERYVVAVADMPYVRPATVARLLAEHARTGGITGPRHGGKRGHPIVVDAAVREAALAAEPLPGFTLHDVIKAQAERRHDVEVDDPGVIRDVDTIGDMGPAR